ncbi:MAG: RNA methyltransferase, partial [Clostridia bacterium]|nr:RNA methyltransferase [Clostridia bacterium]
VVEIPDKISEIDKKGRYIALENLSDPSNLGAISRTAEALGISGIIVSGNSCDPYSPKALRASMGTLLRMPVIIVDDFVEFLQASGLKLFACVVRGGKKITDVIFSDGAAVLIGNEANGLTDSAISACEKITIPMSGSAESLNASVAAAIAMWELKR